jgi:antitoxin component YwqK of YwqJK toxin-antitoxin module
MEQMNDGSSVVKMRVFGENATLKEEAFYKNGFREGGYTQYHDNQFVASTVGYLQGKKEGQLLVIDDKGQVQERSTYHNDELDGVYIKYNRSRIKETKVYSNGVLNGPVEKFYANNNIMERTTYKDGQLDGIARWYDQEGNLTIEYTYDMGELVEDGSTSSPEEEN